VAPDPDAFAPDRWNDRVLSAVLKAERTLEATTFGQFYANYGAEALWIVHWCHAKRNDLAEGSIERVVCDAADRAATNENDKWTGRIEDTKDLDTIGIFQLAEVARKLNPPNCAGFGLIVPLYSVRLSRGGGTEVRGPVDAGLGGGYYWGTSIALRPSARAQRFLVTRKVSIRPANSSLESALVGSSRPMSTFSSV
jgi:hypothetical protein